MDRNSDASSNELADLYTHRLACVSELSEKHRFDEAVIKSFTGGGFQTARRNYSDYVVYESGTTLVIDTNKIAYFDIMDGAFLTRMVPIGFNREIEKKIDGYAEKELLPELPGILNWALAGCRDWIENRFVIPRKCMQHLDTIRCDKDRVGDFLKEGCVPSATGEVKATELWGAFSKWYKFNFPTGNSMGSKTFYQNMEEQPGITKHGKSAGNYYRGIVLRDLNSAETLEARLQEQRERNKRIIDNLTPPTA